MCKSRFLQISKETTTKKKTQAEKIENKLLSPLQILNIQNN